MKRINNNLKYVLLIAGLALIISNSCKKDDDNNNSTGTSESSLPVLTTNTVYQIMDVNASGGGSITDDKGYLVTKRGVCWSTKSNPTISDNKTIDGEGAGSFSSSISGLTANTKYYVRAYATTSKGTGYGSTLTFTTAAVVDIDNNAYHSVQIGEQVWMKENLKVSHYSSGNEIPNVTDDTQWSNLTTGACCDYNNSTYYSNTYGKIYNGFAVNDLKGICPTGWHVPTYDEWTTMRTSLGGMETAGAKLKEEGLAHWSYPNTGATNESGFTALPGGLRSYSPSAYSNLGIYGMYWAQSNNSFTLSKDATYFDEISRNSKYGLSVRCMKN